MSCGCATLDKRTREIEYRIITAWGISDKPVYNIQYFKKGLFGKEWITEKYYIKDMLFPIEYRNIEEAQASIKKQNEEDNFVSEIVSYEHTDKRVEGTMCFSRLGEVEKKGYRPCHGASIFWLLILIGLIIFGLIYFR